MSDNEFKYDVAFSFTQQDEALAFQLYNLLKDRIRCFIYSEAQKSLAGRDGEAVFNTVFSQESRIVVVLYRNEWGKTKWTRIEETAIKNKGFDEGYDFTIVIPLDKPVVPPKWLPRNRLWIGLDRWGIESAASVIEARVQEFGGVVKEVTIADIAAETERRIRETKEREARITLQNCLLELPKLNDAIESQISEIQQKASDWRLLRKKNAYQGIDIYCYGYTVSFKWYQQYSNTLTQAFLTAAIVVGQLDEQGRFSDPFSDNTVIEKDKYVFHINDFDEVGWKSEKSFFTTNKLVEYWLGKLVRLVAQKRITNN